jgi:translation initiation factor 1
MSKKQARGGMVFSTNPDFIFPEIETREDNPAPGNQILRIWLERGKGGKEATVIKGFIGPDHELDELAKSIKQKCATGGSAKNGVIIVQGDHRDKILDLLQKQGYSNVKKAGG